MKIANFVNQIAQMLQVPGQIENPRLEADLLVAHILNFSRSELYIHAHEELNEAQSNLILDLVKRRSSGEPLAYIIGFKEFWSLKLRVNAATLIPRPETEALVEWVLNHFPDTPLAVADLGTGSGAIALALACERALWQITATDTSTEALQVAKMNALELNLSSVEFRLGHWCEALANNCYDLIISNPPYIAENDPHLAFLQYEPLSALTAPEEGLADLKNIISQAKNYLKPEGMLVLEHGFAQGDSVRKLLADYGYRGIEIHQDLSGKERFAVARLF